MRPSANLTLDRYAFAYDALELLLPLLPSPVVFDIGCGDGRMSRIADLGLDWRGFDQEAWSRAKRWNLDEPCSERTKAGAILLLDVIEHTYNPGLAMKHISAAMLPGARLILTVPNPRWSASRIFGLFRGYVSGFTPNDLAENHHVFTPWPHILAKLLAGAGLAVEDYVTLDGRSSPLRQRDPARFLRAAIQAAIEARDPAAIGMSYAFVARKT